MPTEALRRERIEARVQPEVKETIEEAAGILGVTVSSFLVETVQARALEVVESYRKIKLSAAESAMFAEALLKPAAPNAALRRAMARHRAEVER